MGRTRFRWAALAAAACSMALIVGACGGSDDDNGPAEAQEGPAEAQDEMATVRVAVNPVVSAAALYVGVERGIWEKHNLEVDVDPNVPTGALTIPGMIQGQLEVTYTSWGTILESISEDLPVKVVAPGAVGGEPGEDDVTHLVTMEESGISDVSELEDATIAVPALRSLPAVEIGAMLAQAGLTPDAVNYVPIPFPEIGAALRAGRVDAGYVTEPFLTQLADEEELNDLGGTAAAVVPNEPYTASVMAADFVDENPDVVRRFQLGMLEAHEYANENPEQVRDGITEFTGIASDVTSRIALPRFSTELGGPELDAFLEAAAAYDVIDTPITNIEEHLTPFPLPAD